MESSRRFGLRTDHAVIADADLTVINGMIFDGIAEEPYAGGVRIEAGRIVEVGPGVTGSSRAIDAAGATVLPGLIDAHLHAFAIDLTGELADRIPGSYLGVKAARRLTAALARGFTTVRDVAGGDPAFARAGVEGLYWSPRYLYTGAALSQTGGHGDSRGPDSVGCSHGHQMCEVVDGVDEIRRVVRDRFRRGAHAIKLMTSGGVVSPTDPLRVPQYSAEEVRAATEEAARRGSYVAVHAYSPEAIIHSVRAGCRSIEHGNLLDAESAAIMAEHGAYLVPTLAAYRANEDRGAAVGMPEFARRKNREVLDAGRDSIKIARDAGVAIGFGSDLMGDLQDDQLNGLRLQAEADGWPNTLRSATAVNADLIQRDDLGRIRAGCVGDLLVLTGDVFTDPEVLCDQNRPRTVIRSGTVCFEG
ncbi:metal-dependent hydrolase family protein [Microlunatus parietis]|uniref:Imidazolonepropionase-like amidohydrolase n=1 Tax=Microlunatus parietis TaxID=682979 RepID=A0A7Y9LF40_9ACTN|nr:amidohydrolase family protein [Microlunatus parietis]NYE74565.1 imidazolonepropionase-like amidohydrolase [Microlunatus parietis]